MIIIDSTRNHHPKATKEIWVLYQDLPEIFPAIERMCCRQGPLSLAAKAMQQPFFRQDTQRDSIGINRDILEIIWQAAR